MKNLLKIAPLIILFTLSTAKFLQFNSAGEFKILQISDLHYGEDPHKDSLNDVIQHNLLSMSKPDLVALTGDAFSGKRWAQYNYSQNYFQDYWARWTKPYLHHQTPYAYILGNHDAEANFDRRQAMRHDTQHPYSMSKEAEEGLSGASVYYLPVHSSQEIDGQKRVAAILWFFDSGSHSCMGIEGVYGCVEPDQVEWYKREAEKVREMYGEGLHQIGFVHIPPTEMVDLYNHGEFYGHRNEEIFCSSVNSGFVDALLDMGDISALFFGHDHDNDFGGWYDDLEMVFTRKTGYGEYGLDEKKNGARVIVLKEGKDAEDEVERDHFLLLEDGEIEKKRGLKKRMGPKLYGCGNPGGDDDSFYGSSESDPEDVLMRSSSSDL